MKSDFMKMHEHVILTEMPYLRDDERLEYKPITTLPVSMLDSYDNLGSIGLFDLYKNTHGYGFLAGEIIDNYFNVSMNISAKSLASLGRSVPSGIDVQTAQQVTFVNIVRAFAGSGYPEAAYRLITETIDLVSDIEQYSGAKKLWKSLAAHGKPNVYVFNKYDRDYIRSDDGTVIKYNGENIDDDLIWGKENRHYDILLVATTKEIH